MAERAKVFSIDSLASLREAIGRFVEVAQGALAEADAEADRLAEWVVREAPGRWQRELRKRQEAVTHARSEVFRKELARMPEPARAFDERKALQRARQSVEEAESKLKAAKRWASVFEREMTIFRGSKQSLDDAVTRHLPSAILKLGALIQHLEDYTHLVPTRTDAPADPALPAPSAARAGGIDPALLLDLSSREGTAPDEESADRPGVAGGTQSGAGVSRGGISRRGPGSAGASTGGVGAKLRAKTPQMDRRTAAPLVSGPWYGPRGRYAMPEGGLLLRLGLGGETVDPSSRVQVAAGCLDGRDIYMERSSQTTDGESGWWIGPLVGDADAGVMESMTVQRLLDRAPELGEALELPRGYLVLLVGGSVEAVVDPTGRDVWSGSR